MAVTCDPTQAEIVDGLDRRPLAITDAMERQLPKHSSSNVMPPLPSMYR